jgi:hypothetical protein
MLKIKVEHSDNNVAAAVGAIIADALERHDFTKVKAKMVMVYQEVTKELPGAATMNFSKKNIVQAALDPAVSNRPKMYMTELIPAVAGLDYPVMVAHLRDNRPDVFAKPVLIDVGIESMPYEEELKAFCEETHKD